MEACQTAPSDSPVAVSVFDRTDSLLIALNTMSLLWYRGFVVSFETILVTSHQSWSMMQVRFRDDLIKLKYNFQGLASRVGIILQF